MRAAHAGRTAALGCLSVLVLTLFGCGGSAKPKGSHGPPASTRSAARPMQANALGRQELPGIRRMLGGLIDGVNARDARICTRFYTRRYRETLMGTKDPRALARCRKAAREAKIQGSIVGIERLHLRRGSSGEVRGRVQLVERIGTGVLLRARFGVIGAGGGYRIDSGHGEQITQPPPARRGP